MKLSLRIHTADDADTGAGAAVPILPAVDALEGAVSLAEPVVSMETESAGLIVRTVRNGA